MQSLISGVKSIPIVGGIANSVESGYRGLTAGRMPTVRSGRLIEALNKNTDATNRNTPSSSNPALKNNSVGQQHDIEHRRSFWRFQR